MPRVAQGGAVTLRGNVGHANGFPADAADLTLDILDSGGSSVAGFPVAIPPIVRDDLGEYHYDWAVPALLAVGDYTATWEGTVDGAVAGGSETVEVVLPGDVDQPYLTVDDLRLYVSSTLTDDALQMLLDAAYDEIEDVAPSGQVNELIDPGHGDLLMLSREADSIVSIAEQFHGTSVTLAADDYEVRSSGTTLRRLATGTNPSHHWRGRVDVAYLPGDDMAIRKRVQLELVKLDLAFSPSLASQTIGTWSETYTTGKPYADQRSEILASLGGGVMII